MVDDVTAILEDKIAVGFEGGPEWNTSTVTAISGYDVRNQMRSRPVYSYKFSSAEKPISDLQTLQAFHIGRRGSLRSWLLKDFADYSATGESLGTGDGVETDFQIVKAYDSVNAYSRTIRHIKSGTLTVYVNSVEQTEGSPADYTVSSTGLITFSSPPGNGLAVTADFEFYVPVRFVQDECRIRITARSGDYGFIPTLDCVEELV